LEVVFPFTKFLPPQLDERIIVSRILEVMSEAVAEHPLTVVVAPAGSGKTTALAAWERQAEQPVAWVRLGPEDDAPAAIAAALLAGLRRVVDGFGARLEALLGATGTVLNTHNLVTALTNDLGDVERVTLVLDDAHELVDPDTWASSMVSSSTSPRQHDSSSAAGPNLRSPCHGAACAARQL
jgi:LuxR family transcriptional regulator, maltose regulon positive regulatory protein